MLFRSTIFDAIPLRFKSLDHSCDHATSHDDNLIYMIESEHLIIRLYPLFERIFLIETQPRTADGRKAILQNGMLISNNVDSCLWKLSGAHITSDSRTVVYRADNKAAPLSIFMAAPVEWSTEGLQFTIVW